MCGYEYLKLLINSQSHNTDYTLKKKVMEKGDERNICSVAPRQKGI